MYLFLYSYIRDFTVWLHKKLFKDNSKYPTTKFSAGKRGILICAHCAAILDEHKGLVISVDHSKHELPICAEVKINKEYQDITLLPQTIIAKDLVKVEINNIDIPLICDCKRVFQSFVVIKTLDIYTVYFY